MTDKERIKLLKKTLRDAREIIDLCDMRSRMEIQAPEDAAILALCEWTGYGAVIDSAARQWMKKDSMGAHTSGPAQGTVEHILAEIDKALKNTK